MAVSQRALNDALRKRYMEMLKEFFENRDEEVLITGPNEIAFPCVDDAGDEKFVQLVIKVPTGSRKDGKEAYDGYAMAEDYQIKMKEKEAKAKADAEKKAKKIERDKKLREKKEKGE